MCKYLEVLGLAAIGLVTVLGAPALALLFVLAGSHDGRRMPLSEEIWACLMAIAGIVIGFLLVGDAAVSARRLVRGKGRC